VHPCVLCMYVLQTERSWLRFGMHIWAQFMSLVRPMDPSMQGNVMHVSPTPGGVSVCACESACVHLCTHVCMSLYVCVSVCVCVCVAFHSHYCRR
jgi:hypothetical protein